MLYCILKYKQKTFSPTEQYCVCNDGYYGNQCQIKFEKPPLEEEMLLFGIDNKINTAPKADLGTPTNLGAGECNAKCSSM